MTTPVRSASSLVRQLGVTSAAALVVSNMVGTGTFTAGGYLAGQLGNAKYILLVWIIGAVCALAGSFCYSELGINFPSSGGEYVYLTRAYGPTWGFMTGWVSFFAGFSAPIAAAAIAFAGYIGFFIPLVKDHPQITASLLIAVFTVVNCFGLKRVSSIQNILTGTNIAVIVSFIVAGFLVGNGSWSHFSEAASRTTTTALPEQFVTSLFFIYVSYSGWNAATYIAEELKQPARTLPLALTLGTLIVAALYLGLNAVFIYATPLEEMKGVLTVGSVAATHLFGPDIGDVFSGLMALSLASTVSAMVTIGPRLYYAMARNGAFFSMAAKVDERRHTPVVAILCQGACAMLMTLTPFPELFLYIGFTLNFFAVMSVASIFIFRRRPDWQKLRVVSFAFPLVPAIFLLVGVGITLYGITIRPAVSLAAVGTVATGAAVYQLRSRQYAGV
ncbi:MAG: amino acid permease [Bryobacteraceae bacterium]